MFQIDFWFNFSGKTCDQEFKEDTGYITSPQFEQGQYPSNSNCTYTIDAGDKLINITFLHFNVEYEKNCLYDYIKVGSFLKKLLIFS